MNVCINQVRTVCKCSYIYVEGHYYNIMAYNVQQFTQSSDDCISELGVYISESYSAMYTATYMKDWEPEWSNPIELNLLPPPPLQAWHMLIWAAHFSLHFCAIYAISCT